MIGCVCWYLNDTHTKNDNYQLRYRKFRRNLAWGALTEVSFQSVPRISFHCTVMVLGGEGLRGGVVLVCECVCVSLSCISCVPLHGVCSLINKRGVVDQSMIIEEEPIDGNYGATNSSIPKVGMKSSSIHVQSY